MSRKWTALGSENASHSLPGRTPTERTSANQGTDYTRPLDVRCCMTCWHVPTSNFWDLGDTVRSVILNYVLKNDAEESKRLMKAKEFIEMRSTFQICLWNNCKRARSRAKSNSFTMKIFRNPRRPSKTLEPDRAADIFGESNFFNLILLYISTIEAKG